jgi:asparagine synthetase B (glutamine-hydrolysing)
MGGIFGFISSSPVSEKDTSIVEEMNRTLVQRGPDSSGIYRDSNLALARRRLKGYRPAGQERFYLRFICPCGN